MFVDGMIIIMRKKRKKALNNINYMLLDKAKKMKN